MRRLQIEARPTEVRRGGRDEHTAKRESSEALRAPLRILQSARTEIACPGEIAASLKVQLRLTSVRAEVLAVSWSMSGL